MFSPSLQTLHDNIGSKLFHSYTHSFITNDFKHMQASDQSEKINVMVGGTEGKKMF